FLHESTPSRPQFRFPKIFRFLFRIRGVIRIRKRLPGVGHSAGSDSAVWATARDQTKIFAKNRIKIICNFREKYETNCENLAFPKN
ncbi:MAG: hypothetical protein AN484_28600, partial [Aphanizomenon flos-aquae WA102]